MPHRTWFNKAALAALLAAGGDAAVAEQPAFSDYPVTEVYSGVPAIPILNTPEQRRYRTRIREGVAKGSGVWTGSWKDASERQGSNFAGHYCVIRWGCGSNCLMMAVADLKTGKVYSPPLSGAGTELFVPMDLLGEGEIDFRLDSSMMVLRNACRYGRSECGVYYFNFTGEHFVLLKRRLVDLTKTVAAP